MNFVFKNNVNLFNHFNVMLNKTTNSFQIKDLENLSGIKAHTIRIWEKRYELLAPQRSSTNIRTYSTEDLQKLLNIVLLTENGHKISKIATYSEEEINTHVHQFIEKKTVKNQILNTFKVAMLAFDEQLFFSTCKEVEEKNSFKNIITDLFFPFLHELGLLWQTNSINPAHEHFISNLIKQKIILHTEQVQLQQLYPKETVFVLFLPENEIHEIGLLYLNYEILRLGYRTIYLGQAVPLESLSAVPKEQDNICFVSYFTVAPQADKIEQYIHDFNETILTHPHLQLYVLGQQIEHIQHQHHNIKTCNSIEELLLEIKTQKP